MHVTGPSKVDYVSVHSTLSGLFVQPRSPPPPHTHTHTPLLKFTKQSWQQCSMISYVAQHAVYSASAHVLCYDTSLLPAMRAAVSCSRHLCCGISCHPSRVCSALDCPPCRGCEPHPPCVNFIIVWALFEDRVNFVWDLFKDGKKSRKYGMLEEICILTISWLTIFTHQCQQDLQWKRVWSSLEYFVDAWPCTTRRLFVPWQIHCSINTLLIHTPPISGKRCYFLYPNLFIHVKMRLLFYCLYSKSATTMRWHFWCPQIWVNTFFLLLVLIIQPGTPWRQNSPGFRPSFTRRQANAVEFATKVCFLLFNGSCMTRKLCNVWHLRNLQRT